MSIAKFRQTYPCAWLVEVGVTEDGDPVIEECAAPAVLYEYEGVYGTGFTCLAGHRHEPLEIALAPYGPEWERECEERYEETGSYLPF